MRLENVDVSTVERERLQPPVSPGPRRCPRCKRTMEAVQSTAAPSVSFSRCGSCRGSWFEREVHVALLALMIRDFF